MVIDMESQRQAVREECAGEKIELRGEIFRGVNAGAGVQARGVVEDVQKRLLVRVAWEPGVRSGVVLPKRTEVADLPATDRFGGLFVTGVRGAVAGGGSTADAGAIGLEGEAAEQFAGDGAVGGAKRRKTRYAGAEIYLVYAGECTASGKTFFKKVVDPKTETAMNAAPQATGPFETVFDKVTAAKKFAKSC